MHEKSNVGIVSTKRSHNNNNVPKVSAKVDAFFVRERILNIDVQSKGKYHRNQLICVVEIMRPTILHKLTINLRIRHRRIVTSHAPNPNVGVRAQI
jgi:hypothetical protein